MAVALPKTLVLLRSEWISKNLADYVPHALWGNLKPAWMKRHYIMEDIKRRRQADGCSLVQASEAAERDRLAANKTVYQWWELLKARDNTIHRRVRQREIDPNETPPRQRHNALLPLLQIVLLIVLIGLSLVALKLPVLLPLPKLFVILLHH